MPEPRLIPIDSLDDPRIAPYLNLKERDLAREGGRFIAEGELVVRRLLRSTYETESVLAARDRLDRILPDLRPNIPVLVAEHALVNRILGYKFHSGIMACGLRGRSRTIREIASDWADEPMTILVLPEISNTDNMGSLIRIASAFGVNLLVVGEHSCDPFYRQSVRVSMGNIFSVPLVRCEDLMADLGALHDEWGVELIATVVDEDAQVLSRAPRRRRTALLLGNEAQGLSARQIDACDRRVTIPMRLGTDSLNVSVAAGIFLHHFVEGAPVVE